jgi:hypothetical protein
MREFYKFVGENFKVSAEEEKIKSILNIYHRKDGSLSEFRILRDMGYGTGEAIRVIKLSHIGFLAQ